MLVNTIDADGVEVENSPFYQVYVLGLVYQIAQWAKRYEPTLAAPYSEAATKMLTFTADVTMPNGYLPMLGATATTYMPSQDPNVYGPMAAADPEFDFAFTRGAHGTPPPDGTVLFPISGLFLMRSPLGSVSNLPNQTFVTFNSGTYRTSHSDLDAMGITMYSNGAEVLPTSGLYTYTEEPGLEYFHGTRSHNTVVVDGHDQEEGSAQAGSYGSSTEGSTWASGVSKLYPGVTHHRTVVILRQGLVLVRDQLSSESLPRIQPDLAPRAERHAERGRERRERHRAGGGQAAAADHPGQPVRHDPAELRRRDRPAAGLVLLGLRLQAAQLGAAVRAPRHERELRHAARHRSVRLSGRDRHRRPGLAEADVIDVCVGGDTGYEVTVPHQNDTPPTITGGACL